MGAAWILSFLLLFGACRPEPPPPSAPQTATILIPPGASSAGIAELLHEKGLIRSRRIFRMELKVLGKERQLRAGEYELPLGAPPSEIISILASGKVKRHRVTVPEGLTVTETAQLFDRTGLIDGQRFRAKAQDPAFIRELNLFADRLEGFLFPSTYFVARNQPETELILEMVANFRRAFSPAIRDRGRTFGFTDLEIVTLASIIEKETGVKSERFLVSSVFHNRLRKKMKLQSDPTTIYGVWFTRGSFNGNLTRKDLRTPTPYNTYTIRGLPPGPIANPGADSLKAAVNPAASAYLYFVAKGDGSHAFSRTLKEHNAAVQEYQLRRRKKR